MTLLADALTGLLARLHDAEPTFALRHPLGLRALPELAEVSFEPGTVVRAEVTAGHVLECQREVERWLEGRSNARLVVELRGPLSFCGETLARLTSEVTPAQLERATVLLRGWAAKAPARFGAELESAFADLPPWTAATVRGLREHIDGLRRHGLRVDPELVATVASFAVPPRPRGKRLRLLAPTPERGVRTRRITEVALTSECNLVCGFCTVRRADERTGRERAAQAIRAVRAASRHGGTTIVLSGAEPTLEWYLDDLVGLARSVGFERVVVETNAIGLAAQGRARALAEAGVTAVRVAVNSFDAAIADAISGLVGALAQTMAGIEKALDAGVSVELAVALLPENAGELARVVETAALKFRSSGARIERVVARVVHAVPGARHTLSIGDAARELVLATRASKRSGLELVSAPGGELPPCVFEDIDEVASVLRLSEGVVDDPGSGALYARIPLCEGCGAKGVCPGPRRGLEDAVAAIGRRVREDSPAIPPTGERKRVRRELLSVVPTPSADGTRGELRVVRVNFHCNQACDFCFVSRELPPPDESLVLAEIAEAALRGAALSLSGGEPTLNPRLLAYIARATELGIERLDLQTNAVRMSDAGYASALAAAGLRTAFVSLHGTTAATSDRVTSAPGTFAKTVLGIKNLLGAGILARLNFVLCGYNTAEFAEWPDFVAREFLGVAGRRAYVQINFSFASAMTDNVPRDTALLPRFSEVAWALEAALDRADTLGMPLLGFDSQCGVPPCFLPPRVRDAFFTQRLPDGALREFATAFRKGDACARCALDDRCYGVRSAYADMYGTAELRPVATTGS